MANLDIYNFTTLSSIQDGDYLLLAQSSGANGKVTYSLTKNKIKNEIEPTIVNGVWYIGGVSTNIIATGQTPTLRNAGGQIEWKYTNEPDTAYRPLVLISDLKGADGDNIELLATTDYIQWKPTSGTTWMNLIAIPDLKGANGAAVGLRVSNGYIQYNVDGITEWTNIISVSELKGDTGDNIELQATVDYIQWKPASGTTWTNLIAITDLKGANGQEISMQATADYIQWKLGNGEWNNLIAISSLKGDAFTYSDLTQEQLDALKGKQGYSIYSIEKTAGTGAAGTIDTYTVYINDAGHSAIGTFNVVNGANGTGSGDMIKSDYDANNNGIVDNAEKVNGHTVEKDVPSDALFTDTTYSNATTTTSGLMSAEDKNKIDELDNSLNSKVDKETGKGLSSNDFSAEYKAMLDFYNGSNAVTTLASLPVTKRLIIATLSAATDISLASALAIGQELLIRCTPSVAFTQPLPSSNGWSCLDGSSIDLIVGKVTEISILCYATDSYSIAIKQEV